MAGKAESDFVSRVGAQYLVAFGHVAQGRFGSIIRQAWGRDKVSL